ncbi:MAG: glycoside hydrolase family 2 TIM barrel-domain containing protein [Erythrobacter sp.]|uniref:glycoside hydrolase family 2 protein n=1 Tax=Erythrobacter sp. TaxID=1042 RepID=UPI00262DFABE|nr:glycoside hydrolase family 2 TIM barrel-domain containing protein [Erythrobacter sp.]MDJ0978142.1 glycoside hydrolase family 2 TIM barrel-domain containing protein [Erythrobacter sp.]
MLRFLLAACATMMALIATPALAGPVLLEGRKTTSLDGPWDYIVDPQDVGGSNINGVPTPRGYWLDEQVDHTDRLLEYDFTAAPKLQVPGPWNTQVPELLFYEGIIWHRRVFEQDTIDPESRYFVHFGGVNLRATVYLNGKEAGSHEGGFTPFSVEVTEQLAEGRNSLVVKVDSRSTTTSLPGLRYDWWNYGGITREVRLVETPATYVENFRLQLDPADPRYATGWVQVDGPGAADAQVSVAIEGGRKKSVTTDADGYAELRLRAPRKLWSPEQPTLHRVSITSEYESVSESIGFRTVAVEGNRILLNGEPIFLKGISAHEMLISSEGRASSEADARATLERIKQINGNYMRLAHYPHNRHMARVADELGILLWEEIPVYWAVDFASEKALSNAKQQLSELIARDGNRASVIVWSVANETPIGDARNAFLRNLAAHVRSEDPTRLVSAAAISTRESLETYARIVGAVLQNKGDQLPPEIFAAEISDPVEDAFDILSYNQYLGWYDAALLAPLLGVDEPTLRKVIMGIIPNMSLKASSGQPLVLSEFGAGALRGRRGETFDLWTEDYQAAVYTAQLQLVANSPGVAGISPWMLKDMRSPRRPLSGIQDYYNRKGIFDENGEPKLAAEVLSEFFAER